MEDKTRPSKDASLKEMKKAAAARRKAEREKGDDGYSKLANFIINGGKKK